MKNPQLHHQLEKLFGEVRIANEGQDAQIRPMPGLGPTAWHVAEDGERGEQYIVRCPFCDDHSGHLYISYLSFVQPIVDGLVLIRGKLLQHCFRRDCLRNPVNRDKLSHSISMALVDENVQPLVVADKPEEKRASNLKASFNLEGFRSWMPGYMPLDEKAEPCMLRYLEHRRVRKSDIAAFAIGCGKVQSPHRKEPLNGGAPAVLFPLKLNGELVGMQARWPDEMLGPGVPKYWFHPGCRKSTVIYNLDNARASGVGVLCEGVFDAISVGPQHGMAMFGHTPSQQQKKLLTTLGKALIWLPDTDSNEQVNPVGIAVKQVKQWNDQGVFPMGAHVVLLPKKDAGEMTRAEVWAAIVGQVPRSLQDYICDHLIENIFSVATED